MRVSMIVLFGVSLFAASELHAQRARGEESRSVELSLSDEAGEARYRAPSSIGGQPNTEVSYALFLSEDRDLVGSAAVLFGTDLDFGPLQVRLGPQAYAALLDEENEDVFALAIGASARFDIVPDRGVAIVGNANWSPDILTFGSADNLTDMMARAEMRLSDRVIGFAGYRWFRLDLTMRDRTTLQNELFAGINWQLK
jgi:hypothetical protein